MKQYIGTKVINALPMTRAAYNEFRGWQLPADENGDDEGYLVEYVDGGKANTETYKGYVSWSPKDVFERAYKERKMLVTSYVCGATCRPGDDNCNGYCRDSKIKSPAVRQHPLLTFGEAVDELKRGGCVTRSGWNGKGMWLFLIQGSNDIAKLHGYGFGEMTGEPTFRDAIFMRTVDNQLVPWAASQSDVLSEDWLVV